jgi:hypothetical protein
MMFELKIETGNAAMNTPEHIAAALREVANDLDGWDSKGDSIRDENGNKVGNYALTLDNEIGE